MFIFICLFIRRNWNFEDSTEIMIFSHYILIFFWISMIDCFMMRWCSPDFYNFGKVAQPRMLGKDVI